MEGASKSVRVTPKKSNPHKWRLIVDLSSPEGHSVNDGISKELVSLHYVTVDEVMAHIAELGKGSSIAKMDIKQAYRNIPVHPADSLLLGMKWADKIYVDRVLPFGLRSAPLIFSAVADGLQWAMEERGVTWVKHYVDDFIAVGETLEECSRNVIVMHQTCDEADMPIEPEKNEGPATVITFLGLQLDTDRMKIRLLLEKLERLKALVASCRGLLSLVGLLVHAGKAVRPGRAYMRRLIDLGSTASHNDHYICINREARADLEWLYLFLETWNGVAMMTANSREVPDIVLTSDASGSWGCGAYSGGKWFMLPWSTKFQSCHITVKELAPIVVATIIWQEDWRGKIILARSDNSALVVAIIRGGMSRNPQAANLMRCLTFLSAV